MEPSASERRHRGKALAGKSTLQRFESAGSVIDPKSRYKNISYDENRGERFFVDHFLRCYNNGEQPEEIVLDLDATDDPLHGKQEGRFYHGFYNSYCYLPLYIFCDEYLLAAKLRPSDIDGALGADTELARIVEQIREVWPDVKIIVRGDSGFCREWLMSWCEEHRGKHSSFPQPRSGEPIQQSMVLKSF